MSQPKSPRCYVTTAIPYVNAKPHLGFALELCVADAFARHRRQRGADVRFVTGTDDHSLKNVLAAERAGVPTAEWVGQHAAAFEALNVALLEEGRDAEALGTGRQDGRPGQEDHEE